MVAIITITEDIYLNNRKKEKTMKKILAVLLCVAMAACLLTACSSHVTYTETNSSTENGVTTTTTKTTETVNGQTTTSTVTSVEDEHEDIDTSGLTCAEMAADGEIHKATVCIHNSSEDESALMEFYIAPAGSEDWSDNLLVDPPLEGGYYTDAPYINYNAENLVWDIKIVDAEGLEVIFDDIDFSNFPNEQIELYFTYKGDGVWNLKG